MYFTIETKDKGCRPHISYIVSLYGQKINADISS